MPSHSFLSRRIGLVLLSASMALSTVANASEAQSLEELRNTVINLLDGLVQKGVLTREQAQAMVKDAQEKSAAQAKAKTDQEVAEKDAVRVTYVPETVRKQISDQVSAELQPEVTKAVVAQAKQEKWGVPGALPEWLNRLTLYGDVRVRTQFDDYAKENYVADACQQYCYLDYFAINNKGGFSQAGSAAYLNTTEDRLRERLRLRLGLDAKITRGISAGVRLTTGSLLDPVSTNQTFTGGGARYQIAVDQVYLRFDAGTDINPKFPWMTVWAGRMPSPWMSTDLIWDNDLQFDGLATTLRLGFGGRPSNPHNVFLTLGAFPLQEVELSSNDKWLYAGQLGIDWPWENNGRARLAAAYYYFDNVTGIKNASFDSRLTDYTAPQWMQKGNTLFDIRNDFGVTRLFALASEYHLANITASVELPVGGHKLLINADYVTNLGYDVAKVRAQGQLTSDGEKRVDGYQAEVGFGTPNTRLKGDWRAYLSYRYLERDAVIDGFTDSDFHLGGTDARGYALRGEWWFRDRVNLGFRYLSSNEIDGQQNTDTATVAIVPRLPFGIDTYMLDVTGQF
jgi:polyhydroxyalkanoate synthesis regulator phasin